MIIGVTGKVCSGKDTLANFLERRGFKHISLSDILREELRKQKKPVTRGNLMKLGNELRKKHGSGVLARKALEKIKEEDYVVSSIGTIGEIKELQKSEKFKLVFVTAKQKKRFERMRKRKREDDPQTLKEFKEKEKIESTGGKESYREFDKCKEKADMIITNDKTQKDFKKRIEQMLVNLKKGEYKRPSWDEYFMEVTRTIAKRATCNRGRSGCVIAKDKQILATGYVGSPKGLLHCDEVGHDMRQVIHEDGEISQHCVRTVHAEQNAICQAAKQGVSIKDATLYCKMTPCRTCAMLIINSSIKKVVCEKKYHAGAESEAMFKKAGIKLEFFKEEVEHYENQ